jgi:TRAP-type C4-dicarboxylate transport system permease small subunit
MKKSSFIQKMKIIDNKFKIVQRVIMIGTFGFVIIAITTAATLRYFFRKDLRGIEEFITMAAFWMYFTGAIFATHSRKHIGAELFSEFCMNKKINYFVSMFSTVVTVLICFLFMLFGIQMFYWSLTMKAATPVWRIPIVIGHSSILFSFIFMTIYWVYNLVVDHKFHKKLLNEADSNG